MLLLRLYIVYSLKLISNIPCGIESGTWYIEGIYLLGRARAE